MTKLLSDAELTRMRAEVEAYTLPDTCNILSVTYAVESGFSVETWGTATSKVACRIDPIKGYEQVQGAALQPYHSWILTVPHDTTITPANRVEVGTLTYTVKSVDTGRSWGLVKRAELEAV